MRQRFHFCTDEVCSGGNCQLRGTVSCPVPPCFAAVACNPGNGTCVGSGFLGNGVPCDGFDPFLGVQGPGVCSAGGNLCAVGKDCVVGTLPYATGDRVPDGACRACVPGVSRTVAIPVGDGLLCDGGVCWGGTCRADVCSILGRIVAPGTHDPSNPCLACQPAVALTDFSPVPDGTPCTGGVCAAGTCEALSCVIDGIKYPNGTPNPGNACQKCDVAQSRTFWTTLPNNATCGGGCASGFCNLGTCQFLGGGQACNAFSECSVGSCNLTTGNCQQFPKPGSLGARMYGGERESLPGVRGEVRRQWRMRGAAHGGTLLYGGP